MGIVRFATALMLAAGSALAQNGDGRPPSGEGNDDTHAKDATQVYTVITGQVVDALGRGVQHAQIEVSKIGDPSVSTTAQSDTYGDFTLKIEGAHPGTFRIRITKNGFADRETEFEIDAEDLEPFVDLALEGALEITGEVLEFLENQPVVGAEVQLRAMYRDAATETDEAGRFEFKNLIPGSVEISASATGYGKSKVQAKVGENAALIQVVLKPERILKLTVVDDQDRSVAGAAVEITVEGMNDYRSERTDDGGRAIFRQLSFDADSIALRLTHKDYVATGEFDRRIALAVDKLETNETLRLTPAAVIEGTVRDAATGQVLNGARIDIGGTPDYDTPQTFSDISGAYHIGSLMPGPTVVTVSVAGHAPQSKDVSTVARQSTIVDFELGQGRTVSGVVRDPDGAVVSDAEIQTLQWRGHRNLKMFALTDQQGKFQLQNAPVDEFKISVYAPGKGALIDQPISARRNSYEYTLKAAPAAAMGDTTALCNAKVGDAPPPLKLETLSGVQLDDDSIKGTVVLIDFWATWCGPCVAELSTLKRLHRDFGNRDDFLLVSVSSDFEKSTLERFIAEQGLEWHHVYGPGSGGEELSAAFSVQAIPCTILIGSDGKIAAVGLIGSALYDKIKNTLPADGD